jgi:hypothetical protein
MTEKNEIGIEEVVYMILPLVPTILVIFGKMCDLTYSIFNVEMQDPEFEYIRLYAI